MYEYSISIRWTLKRERAIYIYRDRYTHICICICLYTYLSIYRPRFFRLSDYRSYKSCMTLRTKTLGPMVVWYHIRQCGISSINRSDLETRIRPKLRPAELTENSAPPAIPKGPCRYMVYRGATILSLELQVYK